MLEAVLRKNGFWYKRGTDAKGKRVFASLGLPRGTAKAVAQAVVAEENNRILQERAHGSKAVLTFDEAALFYMKNGGELRFLKPLIEELGTMRMSDITADVVASVAEKRYPRCQPQSRKRFVYTPINAIFRMNALAERCDFKVFKAPGVKKDKPVEPATEDWLAKFVAAAEARRNGKRIKALALFLSFTGARITEVCRLLPEHIQDRDGQKWAYIEHTKPGVPRMVQLHPIVVESLADLDMRPGKPIFGFASRFTANQAIQRLCKDAGIKYLSSHKIGRHGFAKRFLDKGYTLAMLKDAGGWLSMGAVSRNYRHLEKTVAQNVVATIETKLRHDHYHDPKKADKSNG